jgi:hypothetical protein
MGRDAALCLLQAFLVEHLEGASVVNWTRPARTANPSITPPGHPTM